jgi:hypothetical protein
VNASDARLANVDLSRAVFRYVVRVVDPDGGPRIGNPSSPLLVRLTGPGGELTSVGFPWRGREVEFYVPEPAVDVVALWRGCLPLRARIQAGESRLARRLAPPVELHIPGMRQLVGAQTRVRVTMEFEGDIGVPLTKFQTIDQKRGSKRSYSSSAMGKSSQAWLDDRDRCSFALMHDGPYRVVARLYLQDESRPAPLALGSVSVARVDGQAPLLTVTPQAAAVRAALLR